MFKKLMLGMAVLAMVAVGFMALPAHPAAAAGPTSQKITVTADCPPLPYVDDQGYTVVMYNWTITVPAQPNADYNIDLSTDGVNWWTGIDWSDQNDPVPGGGYTGPLVTQSYPQFGVDGSHVWARLTDNPSVVTGPVSGLCQPAAPASGWTSTGVVYWTVKAKSDGSLCEYPIFDNGQPRDTGLYTPQDACGAKFAPGLWANPHNYVEAVSANGQKTVYFDGWTIPQGQPFWTGKIVPLP